MNPHAMNGERLLQQGRHSEAAEAFRKALSQDPEDAGAFAHLALALQGAGRLKDALDAARQAARK